MNHKLHIISTYLKQIIKVSAGKILFTAVVLWFVSFSIAEAQNNIRVATAANLAAATNEVADLFSQETGIKIDVISSASGKLTAQIINGAPFHLFISADMKYPQTVFEKGKAVDKPVELVQGQLIFWSKKQLDSNAIFNYLQNDLGKNKIAIANPRLAPYGTSAEALLHRKKLWNKLKSNFVYGENIGQVNRLIYAGAVEGAFTAVSAMFATELKDKGFWYTIEEGDGIPHGVVRLSYSTTKLSKESKQFYDFLFTEKAQKIYRNYGYDHTITATQKSLTK